MVEPYDYLQQRLQTVLCAALAIVLIAGFVSWLTAQQIMLLVAGFIFIAGALPLIVGAIWRPFPIETVLFVVGAVLMSAIIAGLAVLAYDRGIAASDDVLTWILMLGLPISGGAFLVYWIRVFLRFLWSLFPAFAPPRAPDNPLRDKPAPGNPNSLRSGFEFLLFVLGMPFFGIIYFLVERAIAPLVVILVLPLLISFYGAASAFDGIKQSAAVNRQRRLDAANRNQRIADFFARLRYASGAAKAQRLP